MDQRRIRYLTDEFYWLAFHMLDNEPELTGDDAGRIATAVSRCLAAQLGDDAPAPVGWDSVETSVG